MLSWTTFRINPTWFQSLKVSVYGMHVESSLCTTLCSEITNSLSNNFTVVYMSLSNFKLFKLHDQINWYISQNIYYCKVVFWNDLKRFWTIPLYCERHVLWCSRDDKFILCHKNTPNNFFYFPLICTLTICKLFIGCVSQYNYL